MNRLKVKNDLFCVFVFPLPGVWSYELHNSKEEIQPCGTRNFQRLRVLGAATHSSPTPVGRQRLKSPPHQARPVRRKF